MCSRSSGDASGEGNRPLHCPPSSVSHLIKGEMNVSEMSTQALSGDVVSLNDYRDAFFNDYYEELLKAVECNLHASKQFYILVARKQLPSAVSHNVYRQTWMGCLLKPRAEPNTDCWYVDEDKECLELQWTLPCSDTIKSLASNPPDGVDEFLVTCCKEYLNGKLNASHDQRVHREYTAFRASEGQKC